jgi:hypothetical protein
MYLRQSNDLEPIKPVARAVVENPFEQAHILFRRIIRELPEEERGRLIYFAGIADRPETAEDAIEFLKEMPAKLPATSYQSCVSSSSPAWRPKRTGFSWRRFRVKQITRAFRMRKAKRLITVSIWCCS